VAVARLEPGPLRRGSARLGLQQFVQGDGQ
jgi:hypothetical protein